jgi:hypothetical protein
MLMDMDDIGSQIGFPQAVPPQKRAKVDDYIDVESVQFAGTSPSEAKPEMRWLPPYIMGEWEGGFAKKRKFVTIYFQLLTGTLEPGKVKVSVSNDGYQLIVKSRAPDIMVQSGLSLLHSDEPVVNRNTDFHLKISSLDEAVEEVKTVWGDEPFYFVCRIPLKYSCEKNFTMTNKAERCGTRMLYITVKERGDEEEVAQSSWTPLDGGEEVKGTFP